MTYRWLVLSMGWLIYFSFGLINTAIAPLVALIMIDLGLSYTQMGVITGAWQLIYIFTAQSLGLMIDRLGVYKSLLLGSVVISTSSLLRGFVSGFWGLFASVALFGVGGPLVSIGTPKLISVWFRGKERGTASGINASGSAIGSMVALALTNSLVLPALGNWRRVFLCYGALGAVVTLVWFILGRRSPPSDVQQTVQPFEKGHRRDAVLKLLRYRNIWIIVGIGMAAFLTNHALKNWLPRILELKGWSPVEAGYATSLMAFSGILGSLVVPRISYYMRSKRMLIAIIFFVSGISIFLIGIGESANLWFGLLRARMYIFDKSICARCAIKRRLDIGFYVFTAKMVGITGLMAYLAYVESDRILTAITGLWTLLAIGLIINAHRSREKDSERILWIWEWLEWKLVGNYKKRG